MSRIPRTVENQSSTFVTSPRRWLFQSGPLPLSSMFALAICVERIVFAGDTSRARMTPDTTSRQSSRFMPNMRSP